MTKATALSTFRIGEENFNADPSLKEACDAYRMKRYEFGDALKELKVATKKLHDLLDGPLRSAGLVPEGKDWTFKEDDEGDSLFIQVWSEPKQRGRRKPEVPFRQLSLRSQVKGAKAA